VIINEFMYFVGLIQTHTKHIKTFFRFASIPKVKLTERNLYTCIIKKETRHRQIEWNRKRRSII